MLQVSPNDVVSLMTVDIPHPRLMDADFIKFSYAPRLLPEDRTTLVGHICFWGLYVKIVSIIGLVRCQLVKCQLYNKLHLSGFF